MYDYGEPGLARGVFDSMFLASVAVISSLACAQTQPVKLNRIYVKGEKAQYDVKSSINVEERGFGLDTWMPSDLDIQYKFTTEVLELKADGIANVKYLRPTMTEIEGETADSPPKARMEKVGLDLILTMSPANEILKVRDVGAEKKEAAKKPKPKPPLRWAGPAVGSGSKGQIMIPYLNEFVGEIYRLALFLGTLDSSMDLAPRLPFDEVKPGDTWKRTVGYSPQKLKGKGDKLAVQRLDYLFTYAGLVQSQNKQVHRVTADLELKTDIALFIHQTFEVKSDITGLKEIPLEFKGRIEFDLDAKTMKTIRAVGTSSGGFKVFITQYPNQAVLEENLKGRTIMKIIAP